MMPSALGLQILAKVRIDRITGNEIKFERTLSKHEQSDRKQNDPNLKKRDKY